MPFVLPPSPPSLSTQNTYTSWPGGVDPTVSVYKGGKRKTRQQTRRRHRRATTRRARRATTRK